MTDPREIAKQAFGEGTEKSSEEQIKRQAELAALEPIDFATLDSTVKKWMLVPDPGIIKFLCALYVANKLKRKAVWAIIIGPSGGGKTELLNGLQHLPDIYEISMLTPNTFLSGMPGNSDASLLPKLDKKIAVFKDWTSILSMQKDAKAEVMAQFREIWDGRMTKIFGNGKTRVWTGKVGLIAASTTMVDFSQQMSTTLGERFINYRVIMPDRKEVARRSLKNDKSQEEMTRDITGAFFAFMKGIDFEKEHSPIPDKFINELIDISDFATLARSGIIRDFGMKKEVIFVPAPEMPTRIVQQLNSVASGLSIVNGGTFMESDMEIIYKCALDSIPGTNYMVIKEMARGTERTTSEIATSLGYPTGPIRMYLENLALLGVCKRIKGTDSEEGGAADKWTLYPQYVDIMCKFEKIEKIEAAALVSAELDLESQFAAAAKELEAEKAAQIIRETLI